jgi:hypothetical protein
VAGSVEAISRDAGSSISQKMLDLEGEGPGRLFRKVMLLVAKLSPKTTKYAKSRATVDGHREEAFAALAIGGS